MSILWITTTRMQSARSLYGQLTTPVQFAKQISETHTLQAKINVVSDHFPHLQWGQIHWDLKDVYARINTYSIFSEDSQLESWSMNSTFVLCFTRIEATSGNQKWWREMVYTQRLYCVLHALRRHEGSKSEANRWYEFIVCIVFYMRWGDIRVP